MNTITTERPNEISGSEPNQGDLQDSSSDYGSVEILGHTSLDQLIEKKNSCGFLQGKDAEVYVSELTSSASPEKSIDIPSLLSKLSSLLPGDRQLERRARKLAWQLSKGRRVTWVWDFIFLSELTPAESRMPDDEFMTRYADQVKTSPKKGGRPRKYRTATAQKKGHAEWTEVEIGRRYGISQADVRTVVDHYDELRKTARRNSPDEVRNVGRSARYGSNRERQAAYRARLREKRRAELQLPTPVTDTPAPVEDELSLPTTTIDIP